MHKPDRLHWKLQLSEGIILVLLGIVAVFVPFRLEFAFFVWLFFIAGVAGLITTLIMRRKTGFWWSLLSAVLAIVVGAMLLGWPVAGVLSLTYVLIAFFFIEGIASIMYAIEHRRELTGGWGWMLASGVVTLALGVIILIGLPGTAAWALGLLVGIDMVFGGAALMAVALAARNAANA